MVRAPSPSSAAAVVVVAASFVAGIAAAVGGGCVPQSTCPCIACANAITLFVVDEAGAAIDDGWTVEATLDGLSVDTTACNPGARTGNQCSFGFESGVYEIVVRTPSEEKHVNGRVAARGGVDCCVGACLPTENVPVVLGVQ